MESTSIDDVHYVFFFQAEDGIRDADVTGVQTCALPISAIRLGATRSTCPSGSSTCISSAQGSLRGAPWVFAPLTVYSWYRAGSSGSLGLVSSEGPLILVKLALPLSAIRRRCPTGLEGPLQGFNRRRKISTARVGIG